LISPRHLAGTLRPERQALSNVQEHDMKRTTVHAASATAAIAGFAFLAGCSTPKVEPTKAAFYRNPAILLDSEYQQPIRLTLGAGDRVGVQVREAYLARAEGTQCPPTEPVVIAQTAP